MFQPSGYSTSEDMLTANYALIPISCAETACPAVDGCNGMAKRVFDIFGSLVLLALAAVLMAAIAVAIHCDSPGRILFRQRRIGYGNVAFETLKFRTMHDEPVATGSIRQATPDDPRKTRVGAFLRKWSLDELPQLFNVLRGEMSLVGPRPHAPGTQAGDKPFEMVTPRYFARHRVRPGITGLAQVRGQRGETETEDKLLQRVASDLEYIENWSFWLDLTILARTVISVAGQRNAY
jgi:lipopolysaccharide/colanic/teichoic acid biosynthesis glycosyltransferase